MRRTLIMALAVLFVALWGSSSVNAAEDVTALVKVLQKQVAAQAERIEQLEARQGDQTNQADIQKALAGMGSNIAPNDMRTYWKNGLHFDSVDGNFKLTMGGRFLYDLGWMSCDDQVEDIVGRVVDGAQTRSARMYAAGSIYKNVDYKLEFDFAGGNANLTDAYIKIRGLGLGPIDYVQIGHFNEPFDLEQIAGSKYPTFLEFGLPCAFTPGRNGGVMTGGNLMAKRMSWHVGLFRPTDNFGNAQAERAYHVTGRATYLPWYENGGADLMHVAAAYSYRSTPETNLVSYSRRPDYNNTLAFVDTGNFDSEHTNLFSAEAAWVCGPLSVQGYYAAAMNDADDDDDVCLDGFYGYVSYFLTGEHRNYNTSNGTFGRISPKANFGADGCGAWEVAARYSYLDLSDGEADGGRLATTTLGLNWYLNPQVRIMWNWVHAMLDRDSVVIGNTDHDGDADIFMMRTQFEF